MILFRADSSLQIGTGHIMRDLVLASQLQKEFPHAKIVFATQNLEGNINYKITEAGYEIITLNSHAIEELLEVIKAWHPEGICRSARVHMKMLVIDHYSIDAEYEKELKDKNPMMKILSFDDTYEKHFCDILLNHNISANANKYKNLVPTNCELRCGMKYTLLRDEFYESKRRSKKKNSKRNILIAMGGTDNADNNIKILEVLKKIKNIKVRLVTTTANKNLKKLQNYTRNKKWVQLHINTNKIAKWMAEADFGIITPSVTANEAYFMKLPFIVIKIASNQDDMYSYLKRMRYKALYKFNAYGLKKVIKSYFL
ncbi:MAG: UDP-2,4-diacetamido-2,4,6-trideoxy-beta-L-altropyranose hydrolase [Sulfurimonas sp.]|jgi:UDP-2,4-diacetamido-2,4,6-trideoxy-beta-L-altropyranose hydrolase